MHNFCQIELIAQEQQRDQQRTLHHKALMVEIKDSRMRRSITAWLIRHLDLRQRRPDRSVPATPPA